MSRTGPGVGRTKTAYDPVRDVYLLLTGNGPVFGVFVNPMGVPVTGALRGHGRQPWMGSLPAR